MSAIYKVARIVNKSLVGEPEHPVLQTTDNTKIFEFSEIIFVREGSNTKLLLSKIQDKDLTNEYIVRILNQQHTVNIMYYEPNKDLTIIF
jgi:hypothetical protein